VKRRTMLGVGVGMIPGISLGPVTGDATSRMQDAMDEAAKSGRPLVLEPVMYTCRSLNVPKGLVMVANTPGGYGINIGAHATIALAAGTNDHLLKGAVGVGHVRITGVHFDGNKNNNARGDIIHLADARVPEEAQWHIRDCFIEAGATHGIYVGNGRRCVQISDSTINYNRSVGVRLNGSDAHLDRCIIGSNGELGVGVGGTVCDVHACDIYNNKTGVTVYSTLTKVTIRANRIDRHSRQGILVSKGCRNIVIAQNLMHMNQAHIVDQAGNDSGVIKSDNVFSVD
jgi:hypothetical protein